MYVQDQRNVDANPGERHPEGYHPHEVERLERNPASWLAKEGGLRRIPKLANNDRVIDKSVDFIKNFRTSLEDKGFYGRYINRPYNWYHDEQVDFGKINDTQFYYCLGRKLFERLMSHLVLRNRGEIPFLLMVFQDWLDIFGLYQRRGNYDDDEPGRGAAAV